MARYLARIAPASPTAYVQLNRGPLIKLHGSAGVSNLSDTIAQRMQKRAIARLAAEGFECEIELVRWPGPGQGAAISLIAEHEDTVPATFVGLGERGKPSEAVADEAVDQLLAFEAACALPSTLIQPIKSCCHWPSRQAAANSPFRK